MILLSLVAVLALAAWAAVSLRPRPEYEELGDRTEFAPGACVLYGPSAGNHGPVVFLDAGHGGPDPGVTGSTGSGKVLTEKAETLAVTLEVMHRLTSSGYRVALSRVTDTSVAAVGPGIVSGGMYTLTGEHRDLEARVDCANASQASLLLSIHFDGFTDPTVGGTATLYDDARPFTPENDRFANLVQSAVLGEWTAHQIDVPDRGVIPDSQAGTPALTPQGAAYGHLLLLGPAASGWLAHPTLMPGALSEPLFLTDPGEADLADSTLGRHLLADAYTQAINRFFHG